MLLGDRIHFSTAPMRYERGGLIYHLDGVDNAGKGIHDPGAKSWANLAGGGSVTPEGGALGWTRDSCLFDGATFLGRYSPDLIGLLNADNITLECVWRTAGAASGKDQSPFAIGSYSGQDVNTSVYSSGGDSVKRVSWRNVAKTIDGGIPYGETCSLSMYGGEISLNGEYKGSVRSGVSGTDLYFTVGRGDYSPYTPRWFTGEVCSVRIYNRKLTPEEVERNYMADRRRFGI